MSLPKLAKPIAGLAGLSAVSVGGVLLYKSPTPELEKPVTSSLRDLLSKKNKGKRLISEKEDHYYWTIGWKAYLSDNKESNPWGISDWSKNKAFDPKQEVPTSFIDSCLENSKKEIAEGDSLYSQVIRYCTRNTTVSDLILENASGRDLMAKAEGFTYPSWNTALSDYKKAVEVTGTDVWGIKIQDPQALNTLMDKCSEKSSFETGDVDSEVYKQVLSWCTEASQPEHT
ncbi:hypothetical protein HF1_11150 [Mycoplasma haemofelis str. Langford 1]|uniref:Uncharacterized protein n=1 Tax=Mycoplasma haemofelis (strain Langford 1) TaxID=941640 RepID=E8ZJ02_MYCHL|nr:hypothetical protein [Mycoplasma haemofelis]CBY93123.1 hypothetical protein HF1_11150 [Mycoplasma haemofelis str. Langford 1]